MTDHEYNELITGESEAMLRIAATIVGRSDAEDVCQMAYLALWQAQDKCPVEKGRAWLLSQVIWMSRKLIHKTARYHALCEGIQACQPVMEAPTQSFPWESLTPADQALVRRALTLTPYDQKKLTQAQRKKNT